MNNYKQQNKATTQDTNEIYNSEVQQFLLRYMLTDPDAFLISRGIIRPEYFHDTLRPAVKFILEHSDTHRALPPTDLIQARANVRLERLLPEDAGHLDEWYKETVEGFCRFKAMEMVIYEGPALLEQGRGGEVERRIKEAQSISLTTDLGTDYFHDPATRLERMKDKSNYVSTGWKSLDRKLYGGFTRGALNIWAGGSGSGKSLWLQNIALNWVFMGLNVVYFTLELSEDLVSARLDAMVSGVSTTEVFKDTKGTALKLKMISKRANQDGVLPGKLVVKKLSESGTTTNDLRAFLKEYEIKTGIRPDAVVVDYLDLMYPNNRSIDVSNAFTKDKFVSEEMRALAGEYQYLFATASQLNRQAVEAQGQFDHSHIAGGISKINTADNVFAIFTTKTMQEQGRYRIHFLKTRSSNAVGSDLDFAYNPISMRIYDMDAEAEAAQEEQRPMSRQETASDLKDKLNGTGTLRPSIIPNKVQVSREEAPPPPNTGMSPLDLLKRVQGDKGTGGL